ncbi:hypothetical protein [Streptobacillus moniliformis]|uniref:hypothetical protein n=1 Tax=Streptobacillus moniliformis TaxID=34105 RepID=UPI0007E3E0DA|nr:hypothetical protein [Streptobacillus moniliformis]
MKMDYKVENKQLLTGFKDPVIMFLELSTGTLKMGDIIDDQSKIITEDTEVYGIVAEDIDASKGKVKIPIYVEGEFIIDYCNYGNVLKEEIIKKCKKQNIYLRKLGGK